MTATRAEIARANLAQLLAQRDRMLQDIERLASEIAAAVWEVEVAEDDERQEKETDSE